MSTLKNKSDLALELAEGIGEKIANERLNESDIPDNFQWLVNKLDDINRAN